MDIDRNAELAEGEYLGLYMFEGCQILAVLSAHMDYGKARAAWVCPTNDDTRLPRTKPAWWPNDPDVVRSFGLDNPSWRDLAHGMWAPDAYPAVNVDDADWAAYIPRTPSTPVLHGTVPLGLSLGSATLVCTVAGDVLATINDGRSGAGPRVGPPSVRYTHSAQVRAEGLLLSKTQDAAQALNLRRVALTVPLHPSIAHAVSTMVQASHAPQVKP